ncbi:MAG TPA: hypothetical protein VMV95_00140 [Bacillota bacterium]|nr:hypothetical protein [Bacillota bacterium]
MNSYKLTFLIVSGIFIILTIIWGVYIVKLQLEFTNTCEIKCYNKNMSYDVTFKSFPWKTLNGKCYCKELITEAKLYDYKEPEVKEK